MSMDTHPDAERMQVELLRSASMARRFRLVRSLSTTTVDLARRAIRRRHPGFDERDVLLMFVALHYGEDLARRLREHLESGPS